EVRSDGDAAGNHRKRQHRRAAGQQGELRTHHLQLWRQCATLRLLTLRIVSVARVVTINTQPLAVDMHAPFVMQPQQPTEKLLVDLLGEEIRVGRRIVEDRLDVNAAAGTRDPLRPRQDGDGYSSLPDRKTAVRLRVRYNRRLEQRTLVPEAQLLSLAADRVS